MVINEADVQAILDELEKSVASISNSLRKFEKTRKMRHLANAIFLVYSEYGTLNTLNALKIISKPYPSHLKKSVKKLEYLYSRGMNYFMEIGECKI